MPKIPTRKIQEASGDVGRPNLRDPKEASYQTRKMAEVAKAITDTATKIIDRNEKEASEAYTLTARLEYSRELKNIEAEARKNYDGTDHEGYAQYVESRNQDLKNKILDEAPNGMSQRAFLKDTSLTEQRTLITSDVYGRKKKQDYFKRSVDKEFNNTLNSVENSGDIEQASLALASIHKRINDNEEYSKAQKETLVKNYNARTLSVIVKGHMKRALVTNDEKAFDEAINFMESDAPLAKELMKDIPAETKIKLKTEMYTKKRAFQAKKIADFTRRVNFAQAQEKRRSRDVFNKITSDINEAKKEGEYDPAYVKAKELEIRNNNTLLPTERNLAINRLYTTGGLESTENEKQWMKNYRLGLPNDKLNDMLDEMYVTAATDKRLRQLTAQKLGKMPIDVGRAKSAFKKFDQFFGTLSHEEYMDKVEEYSNLVDDFKDRGKALDAMIKNEKLPEVEDVKKVLINFKDGDPVSSEVLAKYNAYITKQVAAGKLSAGESRAKLANIIKYNRILSARRKENVAK